MDASHMTLALTRIVMAMQIAAIHREDSFKMLNIFLIKWMLLGYNNLKVGFCPLALSELGNTIFHAFRNYNLIKSWMVEGFRNALNFYFSPPTLIKQWQSLTPSNIFELHRFSFLSYTKSPTLYSSDEGFFFHFNTITEFTPHPTVSLN